METNLCFPSELPGHGALFATELHQGCPQQQVHLHQHHGQGLRLRLSQVLAGSFLSSSWSSQLQSNNLLSLQPSPYLKLLQWSTLLHRPWQLPCWSLLPWPCTLYVYKMSYFRSFLSLQLFRPWTTLQYRRWISVTAPTDKKATQE
jgi:hypothetical protein